ncbi:MAG: sugar kinase [Ramlibacter sp.]|nr:sugar kinase [Cryobacterium sp.]
MIYTGSVIVDIVLTLDRVPPVGGDALASSSRLTAGGGYTVMTAAARDGLPVTFAGQYGSGPFGDIVRSALAEAGFDTVQPGLADLDSGYCVALVDRNAERTFVTAVGAEGRLGRADLDAVEVRAEDTVYVSGYSLAHPFTAASLPAWLAALPPAARVITDPSPLVASLDLAILAQVMARTDVFTANAREARLATGLTDLSAAAAVLATRLRPGGFAVVRDGPNGCWLCGPAVAPAPVHVRGFPVTAVDTTGAGDAHGGILAAALARGLSPVDAATRANAAAALAVTVAGPATAPGRAAIDAFLRAAQR